MISFFEKLLKRILGTDPCCISVIEQQRVVIPNKHGEKLVGLLHETGSKEIVVLCHGFRSTKVGKF